MVNFRNALFTSAVKKGMLAELFTDSTHCPGLTKRLRDHFNRHELEDLANLASLVAHTALMSHLETLHEEDNDAQETSTAETDGGGETVDQHVPPENEEGRADDLGGDAVGGEREPDELGVD